MLFSGLVAFVFLIVGFLVLRIHLLWIFSGRPGMPPIPKGCLRLVFVPFGILVVLVFLGWLASPTIPSASDIVGRYEIDRKFHPGAQADWQHETYQLEITREMVLLNDTRTETEWHYPISWGLSADYRWSFATDEPRHHMVQGGPAILREAFGHYYVFQSPLYGDVVFRKKRPAPAWLPRVLIPLVVVAFFIWRKERKQNLLKPR